MNSTSERLPRIPSYTLTGLAKRTEEEAAKARDFNSKIGPDHEQAFYLAGMNLIAAKFYKLARNDNSNPHEIRMYADLLINHFEHQIKREKNAIALRHLKLLEAKSKALQELAKDSTLTDTQYFGKLRQIFGYEKPVTNGHKNGQPQRLIENASEVTT